MNAWRTWRYVRELRAQTAENLAIAAVLRTQTAELRARNERMQAALDAACEAWDAGDLVAACRYLAVAQRIEDETRHLT